MMNVNLNLFFVTILLQSSSNCWLLPKADAFSSPPRKKWICYNFEDDANHHHQDLSEFSTAAVALALRNPFQNFKIKFPEIFRKKEQEEEKQVDLSTIVLKSLTVKGSNLLPVEVVQLAARRSGLLGKPLSKEAVSECAKVIKQWYQRNGYLLHSVTGVSIDPEGRAFIEVEEPKMSSEPVAVAFAKEMVVVGEGENGDQKVITMKQYRKQEAAKNKKAWKASPVKREDLNTTFVQTTGRTRPEPISSVLELEPGKPFRWEPLKWQHVLQAGLFNRVLKAEPTRLEDGTVQFRIIGCEPPPRNLEYGVTKSLYTGGWEGELDFEYKNVFGGGEVAGLVVRRGRKEPVPSIKIRFSDNNFGRQGGYSLEAFNEFISIDEDYEGVVEDKTPEEVHKESLSSHAGITCKLNKPLAYFMDNSAGSASLERTLTHGGSSELVASTEFDVGPWLRGSPEDSRHSLLTIIKTGARIGTTNTEQKLLPYTAGTIVAREIFPMFRNKKPIEVALKHSVSSSSVHIPRHEANALGVRSTVRGYPATSNGGVLSGIAGTTEIRIPITLPSNKFGQDASIVLFGDWNVVNRMDGTGSGGKQLTNSKFMRKSSVGIGIRKHLAGIPLKYDLSYTADGRLSTHFGIGKDFDVL